jgi:tetratricopeptide (TPR) repeat protein
VAPAAATSVVTAAQASPDEDAAAEANELRVMREKSPHAASLLAEGEALLAAGRPEAADALFVQAEKEFLHGAVLQRRDCQARLALGQHDPAILACNEAFSRSRSESDARAVVHALLSGPAALTTSEILAALAFTAEAHQRAPTQPTAAATACDIAGRIGNQVMLQQCTEELERLSPNDPATREAEGHLARRCPPWRFWTGWSVIGLGVFATLGDAMRRRLARRGRARSVVAAVAVVGGLALAAPVGLREAFAAEAPPPAAPQASAAPGSSDLVPENGWLSRWPIDAAHPEAHIPSEAARNADPLQFGYWLQDLIWAAGHASKRGDHAQAVKYYLALATAIPDRPEGFTRACSEYEAMGELDHAINACGQGLLRNGVLVRDYDHFVHLILAKPGPLGKKDNEALSNILAHMREDPTGRDFVDELECEVGARNSNVAQLRECTAAMAARGANDAKFFTFQWNLAMQEHKYGLARAFVERARLAGLAPPAVATLLDTTRSEQRWYWLRIGLAVLALGLLAGGVRVAVRALQRRRAGASGGTTPPAASPPSSSSPPPAIENSPAMG